LLGSEKWVNPNNPFLVSGLLSKYSVSNLENVKNLIEITPSVFIINNSHQLYVRNDIAKPYLERIEREKPERIERLNKINSMECLKI